MLKIAEGLLLGELRGPYRLSRWNARIPDNRPGILVIARDTRTTLAILSTNRMRETLGRCCFPGSRPSEISPDEKLLFWYVSVHGQSQREAWVDELTEVLKPKLSNWRLGPAPSPRWQWFQKLLPWFGLATFAILLLSITAVRQAAFELWRIEAPAFLSILLASLLCAFAIMTFAFLLFHRKSQPLQEAPHES